MTTPEQIDDGGSVTADLICQRHVAENLIAEEKVKSVGGLSVRDYFAAHAPNPPVWWDGGMYEWRWHYADAMLEERKGGA
jgi:hypothetical protein